MTVKCIQSSLIKNVKHGFFTRRGGSSLGIYKGLNCGLGSKDHKQNVIRNEPLELGGRPVLMISLLALTFNMFRPQIRIPLKPCM